MHEFPDMDTEKFPCGCLITTGPGQRGKAAGFDDYLTKPIKMSQFFEVMDQYLSHQS